MRRDWFRLDVRGMLEPVLYLLRADSYSGAPGPYADAPVCDVHNWQPERVGPAPLPRPSECPDCKREAMRRHDDRRDEVEVSALPTLAARDRDALGAAWDRAKQKLRDEGVPLPGEYAEDVALARIEELREIEYERDARRRGRGVPVFSRIEGGEVVTYVDTRRSVHDRPRIVRAG
jgi:hypothetical protein